MPINSDRAYVAVDDTRLDARHPRVEAAEFADDPFHTSSGAAIDRDFCFFRSAIGAIMACAPRRVPEPASVSSPTRPGAVNAPRRQRVGGLPRSAPRDSPPTSSAAKSCARVSGCEVGDGEWRPGRRAGRRKTLVCRTLANCRSRPRLRCAKPAVVGSGSRSASAREASRSSDRLARSLRRSSESTTAGRRRPAKQHPPRARVVRARSGAGIGQARNRFRRFARAGPRMSRNTGARQQVRPQILQLATTATVGARRTP